MLLSPFIALAPVHAFLCNCFLFNNMFPSAKHMLFCFPPPRPAILRTFAISSVTTANSITHCLSCSLYPLVCVMVWGPKSTFVPWKNLSPPPVLQPLFVLSSTYACSPINSLVGGVGGEVLLYRSPSFYSILLLGVLEEGVVHNGVKTVHLLSRAENMFVSGPVP